MLRVRRWRMFRVLLGFLALPLIAWGVYFSVLVVHNTRLMKSGKLPTNAASAFATQASISRSLRAAQVTPEALKRIEPNAPEPTLGNSEAKIRMIEFVDYQCPFCKRVAPVIREFMQRNATEVFFILRDFPILELHPTAEEVAIAARCIFDQGTHTRERQENLERFWRAHDLLFADQTSQTPEDLRRIAARVGTDLVAFDACVATQSPLAHIRRSFADGVAAGIRGTPTFFMNGIKIQGAIDAESLERVFQEIQQSTLR